VVNGPIDARRWRRLALRSPLLGVGIALGCQATALEVRYSGEPGLTLILERAPRSIFGPDDVADSALYALLVTSATAIESKYRTAEVFRMTRRSDGREFAWEPVPRTGGLGGNDDMLLLQDVGNFALPWRGTAGRLGREDLVGGDVIDLFVVTEGRTVEGSVTMPGEPELTLREVDGVRSVHWRPIPGAASYQYSADTDDLLGFARSISDTSYVLRYDRDPQHRPDPAYFHLRVVDANLVSPTVLPSGYARPSVGLSGGYGYFGGMAQARLLLPP
jgi:hypothetical protein